jgi:hypothetical protein
LPNLCYSPPTLLFHHDPSHTDDVLDAMLEGARADWAELGRDPARLEMASERLEVAFDAVAPPVAG